MAGVVVANIETVTEWCQRQSLAFHVLADVDHAVSAAYGVYDVLGDGLAAPALVIVDSDGRVAWSYVAETPDGYVDGQTILDQVP